MNERGAAKNQAHLSSEQVVGYIDRTLNEGVRKEVESHLSECQACLREVLEVTRLLRKQV